MIRVLWGWGPGDEVGAMGLGRMEHDGVLSSTSTFLRPLFSTETHSTGDLPQSHAWDHSLTGSPSSIFTSASPSSSGEHMRSPVDTSMWVFERPSNWRRESINSTFPQVKGNAAILPFVLDKGLNVTLETSISFTLLFSTHHQVLKTRASKPSPDS